jgi:hypothetical protein
MQNSQTKTKENLSFGALLLTIVISNVLLLVYVAPYA